MPQVATEKAEQVERGAVGPVHVLRHDDQGRPRRETLEEQKDVLEQPALRRAVRRRRAGRLVCVGLKLRHEASQLASTGPKQLVKLRR